MTNKIIEGDITDIKEGIICHFCNCEGFMSSGLAPQIKEKFPEAYKVYRQSPRELGSYTLVKVSETSNLWVCNMITQDLKGRGTHYWAAAKCLQDFGDQQFSLQAYLPELVGCGYGKGDPNIIQALIAKLVPTAILVKYKRTV